MIIGIFSMNVTAPRNVHGELWMFGVVLVINLCIQTAIIGLIRYWWVKARGNVERRVKLE